MSDAKIVLIAIAVAPAISLLLILQVVMFCTDPIGPSLVWLGMQLFVIGLPTLLVRRHRRTVAHRQIAVRADYENYALIRGDTHTGVYGQYSPWCRPTE